MGSSRAHWHLLGPGNLNSGVLACTARALTTECPSNSAGDSWAAGLPVPSGDNGKCFVQQSAQIFPKARASPPVTARKLRQDRRVCAQGLTTSRSRALRHTEDGDNALSEFPACLLEPGHRRPGGSTLDPGHSLWGWLIAPDHCSPQRPPDRQTDMSVAKHWCPPGPRSRRQGLIFTKPVS